MRSIPRKRKATIHTILENVRMGKCFRCRLDLPNGAFITKDDLLRYGRTDVDFYKIDDETYFMGSWSGGGDNVIKVATVNMSLWQILQAVIYQLIKNKMTNK